MCVTSIAPRRHLPSLTALLGHQPIAAAPSSPASADFLQHRGNVAVYNSGDIAGNANNGAGPGVIASPTTPPPSTTWRLPGQLLHRLAPRHRSRRLQRIATPRLQLRRGRGPDSLDRHHYGISVLGRLDEGYVDISGSVATGGDGLTVGIPGRCRHHRRQLGQPRLDLQLRPADGIGAYSVARDRRQFRRQLRAGAIGRGHPEAKSPTTSTWTIPAVISPSPTAATAIAFGIYAVLCTHRHRRQQRRRLRDRQHRLRSTPGIYGPRPATSPTPRRWPIYAAGNYASGIYASSVDGNISVDTAMPHRLLNGIYRRQCGRHRPRGLPRLRPSTTRARSTPPGSSTLPALTPTPRTATPPVTNTDPASVEAQGYVLRTGISSSAIRRLGRQRRRRVRLRRRFHACGPTASRHRHHRLLRTLATPASPTPVPSAASRLRLHLLGGRSPPPASSRFPTTTTPRSPTPAPSTPTPAAMQDRPHGEGFAASRRRPMASSTNSGGTVTSTCYGYGTSAVASPLTASSATPSMAT